MSVIERSLLNDWDRPPQRVVSLVPSMTESIIDFGAAQALVGITDYCRVPEEFESRLVRIGGTKEIDVDAVAKLAPELVIANQEENSRSSVEALDQADLKIWLTFPQNVEDAMEILWSLVRLFHVEQVSAPKINTLERSLDWTTRAVLSRPAVRVFCPIWQGDSSDEETWWMTFNRDTYPHDVLHRCGGMNIFADRERCYPLEADLGRADAEEPGERDTRYPRVKPEDVVAGSPDVILLPSEPFSFSREDEANLRGLLAETPAVRRDRVHLFDGSLITWHGTRLARALAEIPGYLQPEDD